MNFLAHLYLADLHQDSLMGQILGDFVKGKAICAYEPEICRAIRFHRKIDRFADSHRVTRTSRRRMSARRRHYAGIMVDLCYDHFLACHWRQYSQEPLPLFCRRVYGRLAAYPHPLPPEAKRVIARMIQHDWLRSYRKIDNIALALDRIADRLSHGERFLGGIVDIQSNYRELEQDFRFFFPELIDYTHEYVGSLPAPA